MLRRTKCLGNQNGMSPFHNVKYSRKYQDFTRSTRKISPGAVAKRIDKAPRRCARGKETGVVTNGPGTVSRERYVLTWRKNAAWNRQALNFNHKPITLSVVAFIYFHFLGDRNLFPPPRLADAPNGLISPAADGHLHDLLTGRLDRGEPSSLSPDFSAPEVTGLDRQSATNLTSSEASGRDEGKG